MDDRLEVRAATPTDLEWIYGLRHRVDAGELARHTLTDATAVLRRAAGGRRRSGSAGTLEPSP